MAKLRITKCTVQQNGQVQDLSGPANFFETAINPASYKTDSSITYSGSDPGDRKPIGTSGANPRYDSTNATGLNFEIVLDGTGVVPDTQDRTVAGQLAALRAIAFSYDGTRHEPNVVKVSWGRGGIDPFFGRLTSLNIDYTLFRPSGEALRAKVTLAFKSFETVAETRRKENRSSPDLTHHITVRAGDTLPLLCQRIYQDPSKYIEVARRNDLDGFRDLVPGSELVFPPMR